MALSAGNLLGPYEILASIGAGGMGGVFRARDTRLGREVALKLLLESTRCDTHLLERFLREAQPACPNCWRAAYPFGFAVGSSAGRR